MKPTLISTLIFVCALFGANQLLAQEKPKEKSKPLMIVKIEKMDRDLRFEPGITTDSLLSVIDANLIESIDVLKGESAIAAYGSTAKDGALIIHLKEGSLAKLPEKYRKVFERWLDYQVR